MTKHGVHIQCKLHPADAREADAIAVWQHWLGAGYTPRQIITDLILHSQGRTPEMYRDGRVDRVEALLLEQREETAQIRQAVDAIYGQLEQRIGELLRNIRAADPDGFKQFAAVEDTEEESDEVVFSDAFIRNARKAARRTFRQQDDTD